MEQSVYVDVLLVTNYIINMLLIMCAGRLSGRSPKRRRIVAAALFGAATSLTIFLPFTGFLTSLAIKLGSSAAIVLIAFSFINTGAFLKQLFFFFAVSFSFAGIMLGIWLLFAPRGMSYYNGVVYFDISSFLLIATTVASYIILSLAARFMKGKGLKQEIYKTTIYFNNMSTTVNGLVDTGNNLCEPFSNTPVAVCSAAGFYGLLPDDLIEAVLNGKIFDSHIYSFGLCIRMIPYANVGGSGVMPAFKADSMIIETPLEKLRIEQAYIGLSAEKIGDERYGCLLNPEFISIKIH